MSRNYSFSADKETQDLCTTAGLLDGRDKSVKDKDDYLGEDSWSQFVCKAIREKVIRDTNKRFEKQRAKEKLKEVQEKYTELVQELKEAKEEYADIVGLEDHRQIDMGDL